MANYWKYLAVLHRGYGDKTIVWLTMVYGGSIHK